MNPSSAPQFTPPMCPFNNCPSSLRWWIWSSRQALNSPWPPPPAVVYKTGIPYQCCILGEQLSSASNENKCGTLLWRETGSLRQLVCAGDSNSQEHGDLWFTISVFLLLMSFLTLLKQTECAENINLTMLNSDEDWFFLRAIFYKSKS